MAKRTIVVEPDKTLHRKARKQEKFDVALANLAEDMLETMHASDGIGLAAPQIGILRRIFTMNVSPVEDKDRCLFPGDYKLTVPDEKLELARETGPQDLNLEMFEDTAIPKVQDNQNYVIINPQILAKRGCQLVMEGCLSVPLVYGKVYRPAEVIIEYQDIEGVKRKLYACDLQAACVCHETDHLNGVMFFQRTEGDVYRAVEGELVSLSEQERHEEGLI